MIDAEGRVRLGDNWGYLPTRQPRCGIDRYGRVASSSQHSLPRCMLYVARFAFPLAKRGSRNPTQTTIRFLFRPTRTEKAMRLAGGAASW